MELAHSLSPGPKKVHGHKEHKRDERSKDMREGRGGREKRLALQRNRLRQSQETSERSLLAKGGDNSDFSGRTPSKLGSILKKKSVHEKMASGVSSMKNIHRIKTGSRANLLSNTSGYNY